jgi:hypothetical protein
VAAAIGVVSALGTRTHHRVEVIGHEPEQRATTLL